MMLYCSRLASTRRVLYHTTCDLSVVVNANGTTVHQGLKRQEPRTLQISPQQSVLLFGSPVATASASRKLSGECGFSLARPTVLHSSVVCF